MAYILCDEHGGNVAALVSSKVAEHVLLNSINKIELMKIVYLDNTGKEYGNFVDAEFFKKVETDFEIDLSNPITSDEVMFELCLELVPVCPVCLKNALSNQ